MQVDDGVENANVGYLNVVPVDSVKQHDLGVSEESCHRFASMQNTAHLNIVEFFHASPYFPIAFIKRQDNNYTPCAVLGLNQGKNLFIDEHGHWLDNIYKPAYIRRYPFITETITVNELDRDVADIRKPIFVEQSALVHDAPSLFIANSVATPEWEGIESFVSEYITAEKLTLSFTHKLANLKLFESFDAQIHPNDGDMLRLKGLYRVNEDKLNKLPAKTIKSLMQTGELSRIYAHLISLENFAKLLDRQSMYKKQNK